MRESEPSRTALGAAAHRAAHQVLERGAVFRDPLALTILGAVAEVAVEEARADPSRLPLRFFVAARARVAQMALEEAIVERGVRQLVVLGAGLDTCAYRRPAGDPLRVFEVDHPATQAWKRRRLGEAAIPVPASLRFVAVDFEQDDLRARLEAEGFDPAQRSLFAWLGVAPYLSLEAVYATLATIAALPGGAEVVFDYGEPPDGLDPAMRARHEALAARVAALGEPILTTFEPAALAAQLDELGFSQVIDLGLRELATRFLGGPGAAPARGGRVVHAFTAQR